MFPFQAPSSRISTAIDTLPGSDLIDNGKACGMKICRNKATREVYICLKDSQEMLGHFVSPDGRVELFNRRDFEAFVEQTDEMYLRQYMVITGEQYRTYRKYKEEMINDIR